MNLKNPIIFILFIFIITSCKSKFDSNKFYVNNNLLSIDTNIINNNEESILKLLDINYNDLNDYNKQYYNLLKIIGQNRNYTKIKSDSSIKGVYNYFEGLERKNKFDKYNFGRSSILYGLIKANLNSSDTTIYPLIKQGQDLVNEYKSPNYYNAIANSMLSSIYFTIDSVDMSNKYFNNAIAELYVLNDIESISLLKIDNILNYLLKRRYDIVKKKLDDMENSNLLINDKIKYAFYSLYSTYYATRRDYPNVIKYSKLKNSVNNQDLSGLNNSKILFSISKFYSFMNNIDSSLIYANYALEEEMSSGGSAISDNLHLYYRNIGDIYSKGLDYHQSSSAYRRAYFYALRTMNSMQKKRLREIERQYNEYLNKTELEKRATQRRIFILLEIIIMLSLIIIVGLLFYKYKISKLRRRHLELKQENLEAELKQSKGMVDVVSLSLGILPNFIDKINSISSKAFASNPLLYEEIQEEINSAKSQSRKRLLDLINSEAFIRSNPLIKHLDILSNQEKMILLLLKQDYSTKYISGILNISQSSIRASKVKIRNKIESLNIDKADKESLLGDL